MKHKKALTLNSYTTKELRWDFYPMFVNLMRKGLETEAYLLMLSTWNFACFRYAVRNFNLDKFKLVFKELEPNFKRFKKLDFQTIDLDKYQKDIKKIFFALSDIKGVQKTGAPKLMHLKVPQVFVMWDGYIRNYYGFKNGDADDYFDFLKLMQKNFHNVKAHLGRTIAKLIDEHNFKTITEPALRKVKLKKKKKE
jgi:hypothetical protein